MTDPAGAAEGLAPIPEMRVEAPPAVAENTALSGDAQAWLDIGTSLTDTDREAALRHFAGPLPDEATVGAVPKAGIEDAAYPSVLLPPGSVDLRAGVAPAAESAPAAPPPPTETYSTKRQVELDALQARRDDLTPDEDGRRKQLIAEQQEQSLLIAQEASGRPLSEEQKARLQELNTGVTAEKAPPSPVDEAVKRAADRLDPIIKADADAKASVVSPDSRTEFDDLQARKDTLTPEENARRQKMIEQQQERTLLLRQKEAGTPLTDAQDARLKELDGAWGEKAADGESKDKPLTAEERANEMKTLREKIKSGDFKPEDEAKLAKLEDDEIEAVAQEYDPSNPESLVATAEKLQDIAESRRGYAENQAMKETMARVFKEWVAERANPEANLSAAEKAALKKVQELVGGMHKDLLTIINANRQIEKMQAEVDRSIKATEAQEKKLNRLKDVSKDDQVKQQEALQLQAMYVDLLNKKAQLLGAANAARLANNSFRVKRTQVRRALGLTGFWTGLIESVGTSARNSVGNGVNNIDTFLHGKPLAVRYANKL